MELRRPRRGERLRLSIEKSVPGGAGLARHEGRVVFVRLGLPGSTVEGELTTVKKSYAEARIISTLTPAPNQIPPRCPHFFTCGGCSFQHLPYPDQLVMKEGFVREAITGIAKLDVPIKPIVASPDEWHYRNKVEFSFGLDGVTPEIGYKIPGTFSRIFRVERCDIFDPRASALLAATRSWIPHAGVEVYNGERFGGVLQYLGLRRSVASGELLVHLVLRANAPDAVLWEVGGGFVTQVVDHLSAPPTHVVVTLNRTGITPQAGSRETRVLRGTGELTERLGSLEFRVSPFSFFQTNTCAAEQLVHAVQAAAALTGRERVLDLYSGTGTLGQLLARNAMDVLGIELIADAVADANANAAANGLTNYRAIAGDVHRIIAATPERVEHTDVVVIDPPRNGLEPKACTDVLSIAARRIVYVSCNPATLARDLALLSDHYSVEHIQPLDLFPHTPHVETVATLVRKEGGVGS